MRQISTEISSLESLLDGGNLKKGESVQVMMKIKRLKKRLSKVQVVLNPMKLHDNNEEITKSMFRD